MIESIEFKNFKALRDTTLPLGRFTLIVGPNGSGKSTALQALGALRRNQCKPSEFQRLASAGIAQAREEVAIVVHWNTPNGKVLLKARWDPTNARAYDCLIRQNRRLNPSDQAVLRKEKDAIRVYSLDAKLIAAPIQLTPGVELGQDGAGLVGVLDRLRDEEPERFKALNGELGRWLPEFDQILFDTPGPGTRAFSLRMREGHHKISAREVSQGTLLALAILTLAYLPDPPAIVGFEEPDRGLHPRLLRDVQDALYRLSYPENYGEDREPVQVIATTHSPYFLDLFRDHPEEVVIASKAGQEATFERLTDRPDCEEILRDAHLGDLWYSGILGGVPSEP